MKTACIIEARMRSSRLPGKVLRPILGRPMLDLLVERLRRSSGVDDVVIATTDDVSSDPIAAYAERAGVSCFRGSEEDVLGRVLGAARAHGVERIVETTGDNPLVDPATIEAALATYDEGDVDYVSNVLEPGFPRGTAVQVFATSLLAEADARAREPHHREHVSIYFYETPGRFRVRSVATDLPPAAADLRVTVDTLEDFERVRRIFEDLYPSSPDFGLRDVVAYLTR